MLAISLRRMLLETRSSRRSLQPRASSEWRCYLNLVRFACKHMLFNMPVNMAEGSNNMIELTVFFLQGSFGSEKDVEFLR